MCKHLFITFTFDRGAIVINQSGCKWGPSTAGIGFAQSAHGRQRLDGIVDATGKVLEGGALLVARRDTVKRAIALLVTVKEMKELE